MHRFLAEIRGDRIYDTYGNWLGTKAVYVSVGLEIAKNLRATNVMKYFGRDYYRDFADTEFDKISKYLAGMLINHIPCTLRV